MKHPPGWIFLALGVLLILWVWFPSPLFEASDSPMVLDEEGGILGAVTAADGQWRFPVLEPLPERYVTALTTFEDRRFFRHFGVDAGAVFRAGVSSLAGGEIKSGASTISMQVLRLALGGRRTWGAKILESLLALILELKHSKKEILEAYASRAPFGGNVIGLETASLRYFHRRPRDLSWGEAATLAVLPNAPGLIHPGKRRDELRTKRNRLLEVLEDRGNLTPLQQSLAREEPLPGAPDKVVNLVPHLVPGRKAPMEYARPTTLNRALQVDIQALTDRHVKQMEGNRIRGAAVIVLETATGKVKAYVGNRTPSTDEDDGSDVDMIQAKRSTGSLYKPLLYALMIQSGELLPGQLVADVPTRLGDFRPENHRRGYDGAVRAREALARSLNIPAVRELRDYGVERFYGNLKDLGVTALDKPPGHYGLSLILGGSENTLWEMTGLFAALGRLAAMRAGEGGDSSSGQQEAFPAPPSRFHHSSPGALRPESHTEGNSISPSVPLLGRGAAWLTLEALTALKRPGEEGPWELYASSRKIAWKTGTSQGYRDAWALGVTPEYTVGVWTGNPSGEGRPGLMGALSAAPLLFQVFSRLGKTTWFSKPWGDLRSQDVCRDSGWPAGPDCVQIQREDVPRESPVGETCPFCRTVALDLTGKWRTDSRSADLGSMRLEKWFVLPPVQEYWFRLKNPGYRPLPPFLPGREDLSSPGFAVVFPEEGSRVFIPVELNGRPGKTVFSAAHGRPGSLLYWHLDGDFLGQTREIHEMPVNPGPGNHSLTLTDEDGRSLTRRFRVLEQEEPSSPPKALGMPGKNSLYSTP